MANFAELKEYDTKTLKMVVVIDDTEYNDKFTIQGLLPQGAVLWNKKTNAVMVTLDAIKSFEVPSTEPKKYKVKTLKPVDESNISFHVLDKHGATIEWATNTPAEEILAWHTSVHDSANLGHIHQTDEEKAAAEKAEAEAATADSAPSAE